MTANVPERLEWSGKNGAEERFFCMTAEPGASFEEELQSLMARYRNLGGGEEDEFLLRFHVSDPVRQSAPLRQITGERNSYVSIVGPGGTVVEALRAHYRLFLAGKREFSSPDSCGQMREEFRWLDRIAALQGGAVPDLIHRTWIYCRDIDNNYRGLVDALTVTG